jgi:hypothetical protein
LVDNPCLSLDNTDSHTDWAADFANSRCSRTVDNSYSATTTHRSGWRQISSWLISNDYPVVNNIKCYRSADGWHARGTEITSWLSCQDYGSLYSCPNGGTLSGTSCSKIDTEYKSFSSI